MTFASEGPMTDLESKGYVVIRSFLPPEVLEAVRADYGGRPLETNSNYGISMASGTANAALRPIVDAVLRTVRAETDLKPDLPAGAAYFATGRGINFKWHQDHESFFTIQNHYDYLNFYIPIIKPRRDKSNLCIVPFDVFEREVPDSCRRVRHGGATRFVPFGGRTLVFFDDSGRLHVMPRNIEELAHTPHLDAGDLLLIRGDVVHRTQDSETERVAMSFRASKAGAMVARSKLVDGGLHKARMMAKNAPAYRKIFAAFDAAHTDEMSSLELMKAVASVPEPANDRRFLFELLGEKRRAGVLGRFLPRIVKGMAEARALEYYERRAAARGCGR
jgi:hypothetical protein